MTAPVRPARAAASRRSATLTYDYDGQAAWLERLAAEPHPMTHDLCDAHADRLSVPQGWRLEDRRIVAGQLVPPAEPYFGSQLAS